MSKIEGLNLAERIAYPKSVLMTKNLTQKQMLDDCILLMIKIFIAVY